MMLCFLRINFKKNGKRFLKCLRKHTEESEGER